MNNIRFNPCKPCCETTGCTIATSFPPICTNFQDRLRSSTASFAVPTDWSIQIYDPNTNVLVASQDLSFSWHFFAPFDDSVNYRIVFNPVSPGSHCTFYSSSFNSTLPCVNGFRKIILPNNIATFSQVVYFYLGNQPTYAFTHNFIFNDTNLVSIEVVLKDGQKQTIWSSFNGYTPLRFVTWGDMSNLNQQFTINLYDENCDANGNNCVVTPTPHQSSFTCNLCSDIVVNLGPF